MGVENKNRDSHESCNNCPLNTISIFSLEYSSWFTDYIVHDFIMSIHDCCTMKENND